MHSLSSLAAAVACRANSWANCWASVSPGVWPAISQKLEQSTFGSELTRPWRVIKKTHITYKILLQTHKRFSMQLTESIFFGTGMGTLATPFLLVSSFSFSPLPRPIPCPSWPEDQFSHYSKLIIFHEEEVHIITYLRQRRRYPFFGDVFFRFIFRPDERFQCRIGLRTSETVRKVSLVDCPRSGIAHLL